MHLCGLDESVLLNELIMVCLILEVEEHVIRFSRKCESLLIAITGWRIISVA